MEKKGIKFRYVSLELAQFAIFEENLDAKCDEMQISTDAQFHYQHEGNFVTSEISVVYQQHGKPVLKAQMKSVFALSPNSVETLTEGSVMILDTPVLVQFASLNYGSMRGALSQKTLGTPFHNYILPPVYFDSLILSPFKIDINKVVDGGE